MFFYASKILWFFATPSNMLVTLVLAGLALMLARRARRAGSRLAWFGALALLVVGIGPLGTWLILPLEDRFPQFSDDGRPVDGIIVLGGAIESDQTVERGQLTVNNAAERIIALGDLARRYPKAELVFSGGAVPVILDEAAESDALEQSLHALGLGSGRILYEKKSRTTYENAAFTRAMVTPKPGSRWLLVTSAWHMPRAIGCFREAGFPVIAYPVDYRTRGPWDALRLFGAVSDGLKRFDLAAKEWTGLVFYRFSGRTDALFPAPSP